MLTIFALAQKDLRSLLRVKAGLFFTFVWPLIVAVSFGVIFSGPGEEGSKIKVAVVDEDGSRNSSEFVARLQQSKEFTAVPSDREGAIRSVRRGKVTAAILLPRGFGEASGRVFYGEPPKAEVWIDPSRKAESAMLQGLLFKQAADGMQKLLSNGSASRDMVRKALNDLNTDPDASRRGDISRFLGELDHFLATTSTTSAATKGIGSWQPLAIEEKAVTAGNKGPQPQNPFDITFPQGILWGIIGCVMTFGIGIVSERTHGTMVRLQMSPITRWQLLAGKALACFTAIFLVEAGLFVVGRTLFRLHPSSWPLLALAALCAAVGFVGIMMLVSVLGKTEQAAAGAGWTVMMPIALLGGGMIPLFLMPAWMSTASNFSPAKWAVLAFEGAIWRGFSFVEMLLPCGILVLIGVACFVIGARAFRAQS
jgi:ABC-2 type transport system permease protein